MNTPMYEPLDNMYEVGETVDFRLHNYSFVFFFVVSCCDSEALTSISFLNILN